MFGVFVDIFEIGKGTLEDVDVGVKASSYTFEYDYVGE